MKLNEIFYSIQGESTFTGLPCVFIRTSSCNLNCSYCDTKYANEENFDSPVDKVIKEIEKYNCKLAEITGGEPLLQNEVHQLMSKLIDLKYTVLLETNGSLPIKDVDNKVIKIYDVKCPGSNESDKNLWENLKFLDKKDEIKFVLTGRKDYYWAKGTIEKFDLHRFKILMSPVHGLLSPKNLADWILNDNIEARLQLQVHKYIWGETRGG